MTLEQQPQPLEATQDSNAGIQPAPTTEHGSVPHGGETVMDTFDKTPLGAVEERLTQAIPDHAGTIDPNTLQTSHTPFDTETQPVTAAPETQTKPEAKKATVERKGRTAFIAAGSSLATLALTAAAFVGLSGGDHDAPEQPRASTSAPANPSETQTGPSQAELAELTAKAQEHMLQPQGTAEEILGNYSVVISQIINERVAAGGSVPTNEDLQYLTGNAMDAVSMEQFTDFVQRMVNDTLESRRLRVENNVESDVDLNIFTTFVSAAPVAGENGFSIESDDQYWAIGPNDEKIGVILANLDRHIYTFIRADVTLPDGTIKNVPVLSGFQTVTSQPHL